MYDTVLIVDQFQLHRDASKRGVTQDPEQQAQALSLLVKPLGRHERRIALIDRDDDKGLIAYQHAGYETITMNGDRSSMLRRFLGQIDEDVETQPPRHMVLVTTDPSSTLLCNRTIRNRQTTVAVWAPSRSVTPRADGSGVWLPAARGLAARH